MKHRCVLCNKRVAAEQSKEFQFSWEAMGFLAQKMPLADMNSFNAAVLCLRCEALPPRRRKKLAGKAIHRIQDEILHDIRNNLDG